MKRTCDRASWLLAVAGIAIACFAQQEQPRHDDTRSLAIARIAGKWVGTDAATGGCYYRFELDSDGNGFIGTASARGMTWVWKVRGIEILDKQRLALSLDALDDSQPRTATLCATNHWMTKVLEMQMAFVGEETKGVVPPTANRILLREESELRKLDQIIRQAVWDSERGQ